MRQVLASNNRALCSVPRSHRVLAVLPDNPTGLAIVRSLGQRGLTVFVACHLPWGGRKPIVAHSRYCGGSWTLGHGVKGLELVEELRALALQLDVGSIMPVMEPHVCTLVRHRECFPRDIRLFVPPAESFEKAVDKDYMHHLCLQLGIPVARGMTLDELMTCDNEESLTFPLAVRLRNKHLTMQGYRPPWKVAYACNPQELQELYKVHKAGASNLVVQEYHSGVEHNIQILMKEKEFVADGGYIGEHVEPLVGGVAVRRVTFMHEQMRRDSIRILQAIDYDGVAGVQFRYNPETGKYIFLEVNPRFHLGAPIVIKAGFDVPFLLWQSHFEPERIVVPRYQEGLRMRSLGGSIRWMFAMIRGEPLPPGQKRLSKTSTVLQFLWHLGPWTKSDIFLLRDLKPFWITCECRIGRLLRWLLHLPNDNSSYSIREADLKRWL